MLDKNQLAPDFKAPDQNYKVINLVEYRNNKNIVLYFYPEDSCESHRAFIDKYGLDVILLADTTGDLCKSYGVWREKGKHGENKMGIVGSAFVIDREAVLQDVIYGVSTDGHAL